MQGEALRHAASNAFRARGLRPGDVLYVVGQEDGRLLLIGRLRVAAVVDQAVAESELGMASTRRPITRSHGRRGRQSDSTGSSPKVSRAGSIRRMARALPSSPPPSIDSTARPFGAIG